MSHHYRPMRPDDLAAVLAVQAAAYPLALHESAATFAQRLATAPDCAWVAEVLPSEASGKRIDICAYLFGYRSQLGALTPLGGDFQPKASGDCLYLHDLAVSPSAAGGACGKKLVHTAWQAAGQAGLRHSALVALSEAAGYWTRLGYQPAALSAHQQAHLLSYPSGAAYMVKMLHA